jgi:hypothetical protein
LCLVRRVQELLIRAGVLNNDFSLPIHGENLRADLASFLSMMRLLRSYGASISWRPAVTLGCVRASSRPSLRTSLALSTVRSWSRTTCPSLRWNRQGTRVGYDLPFVVIGATITVRMYWFISSGLTMTHGRVFLISLPTVGSRLTR